MTKRKSDIEKLQRAARNAPRGMVSGIYALVNAGKGSKASSYEATSTTGRRFGINDLIERKSPPQPDLQSVIDESADDLRDVLDRLADR